MPAISPEISARMQGAPGPDPTEDIMKQKFTEMAYATLNSRYAELAPHVVTFKIHEVDVDAGSGIGVLIVDYGQKTIFVPVVMIDGLLKPLEIMYYKDLNVFLPLSLQWLDEIARGSLGEMGHAAELPGSVPQDEDLRDLVIPPVTTSGRIGLASADERLMFKEAHFHALSDSKMFLSVLKTAPKVMLDGIKLAFSADPNMLGKFTWAYGTAPLVAAFQEGYKKAAQAAEETEKRAHDTRKDVLLFNRDTPAETFREAFGDRTPQAYSALLKEGFVIKDARVGVSRTSVKIEKPVKLNAPGAEAVWMRLFFSDGAPGTYFVVPFPGSERQDRGLRVVNPTYTGNDHRSPTEFLAIRSDGKEAWTAHDIVGEVLHEETDPEIASSKIGKLLEQMGSTAGGDKPQKGDYGFFLNQYTQGFQVTKPRRVESIAEDGGITRLEFDGWCPGSRYVIDKDPSHQKIQAYFGGDIVYVPNRAKFIRLLGPPKGEKDRYGYDQLREFESKRKSSVIRDPDMLLRSVGRILSDAGAEKATVKKAAMGEWLVGRDAGNRTLFTGPAIVKIATTYDVSLEDARNLLKEADAHGHSDAYILGAPELERVKEAFVKLAQPPMPPGGDPMAAGGMAPGGMDPMAAGGGMAPGMPGVPTMGMVPGQPTAPGVSPTDLAIGEAVQELQHQTEMQAQQTQAQMAQLEQQMALQNQANEQLVGVLQGIQQRSSEIASASGGMDLPPQTIEAPGVAAGAIAPQPQEAMVPAMPLMDQEAVSPEMVAQQINPDMVNQVEDFQDRGIFDTAAVSMLAEAPLLQNIVAQYAPNLERATDNLGRMLLSLWMKEEETKEAIGDEAYVTLEEKLRSVFKNLGDVVLNLTHTASSTSPEEQMARGQLG